ncbi:MAG: O-antigen ligase family protein [Mycobacteriaceae bacterium]
MVVAAAGLIALAAVLTLRLGPAPAVATVVLSGVVSVLALRRFAALDLLVVAVLLVLLLPARYRFAPLGAAGTPAALLGLLSFGVWSLGAALRRPWMAVRRHPLRWALLAVLVSVLLSYVATGYRPHDQLESKAADRGLVTMVSLLGLALLAADVVHTRAAVARVVRALAGGGAAVAGLGILTYGTGIDPTSILRLPGFTFIPSDYAADRAGFVRIVSTTAHPIELSVVLAMALPLTLWVAFTSTGRARSWWWLAVGLVAVAIPMTVSRTGVLGLLVGLLVMLPSWSWRRRIQVLVIGSAGLVAMRLAIPGLLGTLRSYLFTPAQDPSLLSRAAGRATAVKLVEQRPFLGRGFGTFLPQRYTFLDNQVLLSAVETGALGLLALAALFLTGIGLGLSTVRTAHRVDASDEAGLAVALLASLAVSVSAWLTYDALSFSTSRAVTFVVLGLLAAHWRVLREEVVALRS